VRQMTSRTGLWHRKAFCRLAARHKLHQQTSRAELQRSTGLRRKIAETSSFWRHKRLSGWAAALRYGPSRSDEPQQGGASSRG